jgi:hypothetical protein
MSYKPRTLFRLIEDINRSLFLPHIQRPFVWDTEQMKRLFDSLMRNYPIQTFLFWRTKDAIKVRQFMPSITEDANLHDYYDELLSRQDVEKVFVLDGQQRLQTLYALFLGSIKGPDGKTDLEAYVDMTSGHTPDDASLMYRVEFSADEMPLPWYRLCDLLGKDSARNAEEIADDVNDAIDEFSSDETREQRRERQKLVRRNLSQLISLLREEKYFWVQELDGVANDYPYKRVLDIFVRVNSGGTRLSSADLMFAAMKESWGEIEQHIEEIADLLNEGKLNFDKDLVLKCITVSIGRGAELDAQKFVSQDGETLLATIQKNWSKLEETFLQLRDFIQTELRLYGDKVIRSYNSFVPLFDYLYHNPKPNERSRVLMRGYYYKSQLFNWYGARTDAIINGVHRIAGSQQTGGFPLNDIKRYFAQTGRDTELQQQHLLQSRLRFIILNLIYVQVFGTSPFDVRFKGNEPHIDHIYPQSMLRSKLELSSDEINHIGNYRIVGATDNIRKRAEKPDSYFQRLKASGTDIHQHLLLKEYVRNPERLTFDSATYRDFRDRRLEAIFDVANRVVNPELQ